MRIKRFVKYSVVGVSTFLLDLLLLYIFTDIFSINYLVSTLVAFLTAVSINYFICRRQVFSSSKRGIKDGYLYFLIIIFFGVIITLGLMYVLVDILNIYVLHARIIVAGFVGIFNFLINDKFNFKLS
jgi:putative flippase GtrA